MKKTAIIYIVIAGILWGSSGIFFNLLTPFGFTALQMTAMRGVVAAIVMSLYLFITNRSLFKVRLKHLILFAFSGASVFGTAALYYAAIAESSVSTAVILMYTAPVFVMIYSVLFLGEKINTLKALSVISVFMGCALVSGVAEGMKFSLLGIVLGLSAGLAYSAYNIFTKIQMLGGANPVSAALYSFIFMGAISIFFCEPLDFAEKAMIEPFVTIPLIAAIGICTCVLPYFLYTLAMRSLPAGIAASLGIIEPMSATLFSVIFFGEQLGIAAVAGMALILGAIFCLGKSE